ncbi:MAG: patatin-like phospholipase family protein [Verrucomicrobiota bacterium]
MNVPTDCLDSSRPVGLALGGGAARGWAHVGVIRALEEAGFEVCAVAGTSIGSLVGAFYAAGRLDALEQLGGELNRVQMARLMDPTAARAGLFNGKKVCELLRAQLPVSEIEELSFPYAAISADLTTGSEIVFQKGSLVAAIRASISIPGIFSPARHAGQLLVDGGLVNPLPVEWARRLGAEQVVAVDLNFADERISRLPDVDDDNEEGVASETDQETQEDGVSPLEQGLQRLWKRWRYNRQSPGMFDVLASTMVIVERSLTNARLTMHPPDLLIRPEAGTCRLLDFHRAEEMTAQGYRAAKAALSAQSNLSVTE